MSNDFSLYLGPLLGFLFTTGTLLFIALNAPKTANAELRAETAAAGTPATEPANDSITEPETRS